MSTNKPLVKYLRDGIAKQVHHFALVAQLDRSGDVEFYIHPAHVSGETEDFVLCEDPENENFDFLFNKTCGPTEAQIEAGAKRLIESLRAQRTTPPNPLAQVAEQR